MKTDWQAWFSRVPPGDGTGQHFFSLAHPELTRNCPARLLYAKLTTTYFLTWTGPWSVIWSRQCLLPPKWQQQQAWQKRSRHTR